MTKFTALLLLGFITSCVSVKLGDQSVKKSSKYSYSSPGKTFYRIKDDAADIAWLSESTSSTISVKSKCGKNLEVDLEDWFMELNSNFKSSESKPLERFKFNNRKALRGEIETSLEGFENKLAITTFIKNSCQYIIVMTSPVSNYEKDLPTYESFLSDFKAW